MSYFLLMGIVEFKIITLLFLVSMWINFKIPQILWDCGPINLVCWSGIDILRFNGRAKRMAQACKKRRMQGDHAGIMICHKRRIPYLKVTDEKIYACGVDLVIEHFRRHGVPFNVYNCYSPREAKDVICNKNVRSLWIFGHGMRAGIHFGHNRTFHYREVRNAPKKDFIGQFHCNAEGGRSLADYILREGGLEFVSNGYRCTHQNRKDIGSLLRRCPVELPKKSITAECKTDAGCAQ
jgi:hypothetical protein